MTIEEKIFNSVITCIASGQRLTITNITKNSGLSRTALAYYVNKKKKGKDNSNA